MQTDANIQASGRDRMLFGRQVDPLPYTVEALHVFASEVLMETAAHRIGLISSALTRAEIGDYAQTRLPDLFDDRVPNRVATAWGFVDSMADTIDEIHFEETDLFFPPPPDFLYKWSQEFVHTYVQISDLEEWPLVGAARFLRDRNLELDVRVDARVGDRGEVDYRTTWIPPEDEETEALLMRLAGTGRTLSLFERREGQVFREVASFGTQQMVGVYHLLKEYLGNLAGPTHS